MRGKIGTRPSISSGVGPAAVVNSPVSNARPPSNGAFVVQSSLGPRNLEPNQIDRRNLKVVRIRPGPPNAPITNRGASYQHSQPSIGSMTAGLNKEIADISEKYRDRVVPGTTVQEFNSIINEITQELSRAISEQANHRQYVEQLAQSHAAEMELKDDKIRQLEGTVEALQSKLLVAYKRIQLNALKYETKAETGGTKPEKTNTENPEGQEVTNKRLLDGNEFEPIRKVSRFEPNFEDAEEPFEGDDEDDTEIDEENGMSRQVTL